MKRYLPFVIISFIFVSAFTSKVNAYSTQHLVVDPSPYVEDIMVASSVTVSDKIRYTTKTVNFSPLSIDVPHSEKVTSNSGFITVSATGKYIDKNNLNDEEKGTQKRRRDPPIVPVTVDKYATPVENPNDPDNPNAWDVTLKIHTGAVIVPVDVVMVIDQSSSMGGENIERLRSAIASGQRFVKKMLPMGTSTPGVRIALVSYDHEPHYLSGFTNDTTSLCQKIRALTPVWGTHTQGGLKMARNIMATSTATFKHIILMSDGLATEQYPLNNVSVGDFTGRTGNAADPIDLVIQGALTHPQNYVSDNPKTPLKPKYPSINSKVGRRNLPKSKYNYSNLSARVTFDGVAGALIYEPKFGLPYYYYFPCNAAINEAQFAKDEGCEIHTIGYDLGDFPLANNSLKLTATDPEHFFTATPENLAAAFDNIAQNINVGVQEGTVEDLVAPGFIIKNVTQSGDVTHLFNHVSHGTVYYNIDTKKLTWNTGGILTSSEATITYRVYADLDYIQDNDVPVNTTSPIGPDLNGFDTNTQATLTYTNSNGEPNKTKIFPRPTVKPGYGIIKRYYVMVNANGQPILADGTPTSWENAQIVHEQDFFLPEGNESIPPKWIKMDKSIDNPEHQKFPVSPSNTTFTYNGKQYHFTTVAGSTPNGGEIGISWRKPVGKAYFAYVANYWMGGTNHQENVWNVPSNWTANAVPLVGQDVEFATSDNNNGRPAVADLHLDHMPQNGTDGRVIGNLINNSDKNLVITNGNQLTINGTVTDNNGTAGTIVVKSAANQPTGTLIFSNPDANNNVSATVEFYNKGYDCADCGMYRRSWQYFGIPVQSLNPFPVGDVNGDETINQWMEPFDGNKWQTPSYPMMAFRGYEITNSSNMLPTDLYEIKGTLFAGNAIVPLTRTTNVNYSGVNLVGNSYTAAIDIKRALTFPAGMEETVYLFNTGTRDQWHKLDGSTVSGYQSGQYLAVPKNLAGTGFLPDRIPSMHAFMLRMESETSAELKIAYDKLIKNTSVNNGNGSQIFWRSTENKRNDDPSKSNHPFIIMDVLGEESADRIWIFTKKGASFGFDNGWDGRKIAEAHIVQLYVMGNDKDDRFSVATIPTWDNLALGFEANADGKYTLEFFLPENQKHAEVYLHDLVAKKRIRVTDRGTYSFEAKKGDDSARFRLAYSDSDLSQSDEFSKITINAVGIGKMAIANNSGRDCTIYVSGLDGKLLHQVEISAGKDRVIENLPAGVCVVRLQNAVMNDVRRVIIGEK